MLDPQPGFDYIAAKTTHNVARIRASKIQMYNNILNPIVPLDLLPMVFDTYRNVDPDSMVYMAKVFYDIVEVGDRRQDGRLSWHTSDKSCRLLSQRALAKQA